VTPDTRLVGRADELARVDAALDDLEAGAGAFVLVTGEPGIGKTAVLAALAGRAAGRDLRVLRGSAAEFERELPFAPLVDALDDHLADLDEQRLRRMGVERIDELAAIFPSLERAGGTAELSGGDRHRVHRAVRELLDGLAAARPLVLVLDDLHWSDPATVEVLAALARRPPAGRVLLVGAHRPTGVLDPLLGALAASPERWVRLALAPLPEAEAGALLDARVAPATRDAILRQAGGNPFYVQQLARVAGGDVPATVMAAVARELDGLAEDTRLLLRGAAAAGEPFDLRLAVVAAGLDEAAARAAADEATRTGLVHEADGPSRLSFRHPIVRRAVYESAGSGWRLGAHDRLRRELERMSADVTLVAHHVERAAPLGDEAAVAVLEAAADRVLARAPASAAHWYAAALRVLPEGAGRRRSELLEARGQALLLAGRLEEARDVLLEAGGTSVDAVLRLAVVERWIGLDAEVVERLERALARLAADDHAGRANLLLQLALQHADHFRHEEARAAAEQALAAGEAAGDALVLAAVRAQTAETLTVTDVPAATAAYEDAAATIAAHEDRDLARWMHTLWNLGWAATHLERDGEALAHFERGRRVARAVGAQGLYTDFLANAQDAAVRAGRFREARALGEEAVEAARLAPSPRFLWWALFSQAATLALMGEAERAEAAMAECATLAASLPATAMTSTWTAYGQALVAHALGDHEEAARRLEAAGGGPDLPLLRTAERHRARAVLVDAALRRGDAATADRWVAEGEASAAASGLSGQRGFAGHARALVSEAAGDHAGATAQALNAAEALDAAGACVDAERARLTAARCLAAAGERDRAIALLERAEDVFADAGAERDRADAVRDLRHLGRRVRAPAPAGGGGLASLSERERDVAELVAEGRTNRQVAETLFLSQKTVETHLRNIFVKLGVSSRVGVASAVEREKHLHGQLPSVG
jgi:DNA-binding NarL/FixJ family response regulator/tetratricopeptide (TPR) repeat protein